MTLKEFWTLEPGDQIKHGHQIIDIIDHRQAGGVTVEITLDSHEIVIPDSVSGSRFIEGAELYSRQQKPIVKEPTTEHWAKAISARIADEYGGEAEADDLELLAEVLDNCFQANPAEMRRLIGTVFIEEDYFDDGLLPPSQKLAADIQAATGRRDWPEVARLQAIRDMQDNEENL